VTRAWLLLCCLLVPACGTPGRNVIVDLEDAPEPLPSRLVAQEVARQLSSDPEASSRAAAALTTLDEEGREALLEHAAGIPNERDPRWLNVLDENRALPDLPPEALVDFLLWKVSRPEPFYVMKAQSRLLDLARSEPDVMLARLAAGGRGAEAIAVALALAGERRAVLPLLARYRGARNDQERRVAAEALARLVGEERRPRLQGSAQDIEQDAQEILEWYQGTEESNG
jgi:hypothetical protein